MDPARVLWVQIYKDNVFTTYVVKNISSGLTQNHLESATTTRLRKEYHLVRHVRDRLLMVRKTHLFDNPDAWNAINSEALVLSHLTTAARSQYRCMARFPHLQGATHVSIPGQIQSRAVTYMDFLNAGNLQVFLNRFRAQGRRVPAWFIILVTLHVLQTLEFMYSMTAPGPYCHNAVKAENIVMHYEGQEEIPSFYLTDFTATTPVSPFADPPFPWVDIFGLDRIILDLAGPHYGDVRGDMENPTVPGRLHQVLFATVARHRQGNSLSPPDLRGSIATVAAYASSVDRAAAVHDLDPYFMADSVYDMNALMEPRWFPRLEDVPIHMAMAKPWRIGRVTADELELIDVSTRVFGQ